MPYETIIAIKRTVYVAECKCGDRQVLTDSAPRERLCKCGEWVKFAEESYTGPDTAQPGAKRYY